METNFSAEAIASLFRVGRAAEARLLLENAIVERNVDAIFYNAVIHMVGQFVPRNLDVARKYLRKAVEIGHVDAALIEIALVANGSGGVESWSNARRLLEIAAKNDYVAAAQLNIINSMLISESGTPNSNIMGQQISKSPKIIYFKRFLNNAECRHLINISLPLLEPSTVLDPATGRLMSDPVRRSDGAVIGPTREDLIVSAILHRIANATLTPKGHGESLSILRYSVGQEYRPHLDVIRGTSNQRVKTFIIYLNDQYEGGKTKFLSNDLCIETGLGDAILFDNICDDGSTDKSSLHCGMPVLAGQKWIATRWIRSKNFDPWTYSE